MKHVIIFVSTLLFLFTSKTSFAEILTKDVLAKLDFEDHASFLARSDTSAWQCGVIDDDVAVRYFVNGDVIAYDEVSKTWYHFITPVKTELPVESLTLFVGKNSVVKGKIARLSKSACEQKKKSKAVNDGGNAAPKQKQKVKKPKVPDKSEKVSPPLYKGEQSVALVPGPRKKTVFKEEAEKFVVFSTWEFMDLYQQQIMGGQR